MSQEIEIKKGDQAMNPAEVRKLQEAFHEHSYYTTKFVDTFIDIFEPLFSPREP